MLGGNPGRYCTSSTSSTFRIFGVNGFQNRLNDIVYCPPIFRPACSNNKLDEESTAVVYFGGDVQDFPESMETNRDSRGYMKYNLESSAILLRNAFPKSHIIIVRPVRMEFKTFSCFDNFVRGNNAGVPDHTPMNHALQHLEKLLQNLSQRLKSIPENEILAQIATTSLAQQQQQQQQQQLQQQQLQQQQLQQQQQQLQQQPQQQQPPQQQQQPQQQQPNDCGLGQDMDIDVLQVHDNNTIPIDNVAVGDSLSFTCSSTREESLPNALVAPDSQSQVTCTATNNEGNTELATSDAITPQNQLQFNNSTNTSGNNTMPAAGISGDAQHNYNRNPLWWRENLNLDKSKLLLIGFSKGCVVLNQFIYEFHYLKTLTPDDSTMIRLLQRIKEMYWLDGGHGGQKNTWITSRSLLETLTRLGINVNVHVTPYQIQDDRRPWIRKEEKIFSDLLRRLGAPITRNIHFDNTAANLVTHFEVLQAFCHMHIQQLQQAHIQQQQQLFNKNNSSFPTSTSNDNQTSTSGTEEK